MNKEEFMRQLSQCLQNIPEQEREEALSYYEDYFADAGSDNEQQVIEELGDPRKIADNVKESVRENINYQNVGSGYQNTGYQTIGTQNVFTGTKETGKSNETPAWVTPLVIIGIIVLSPVWMSAIGTIIGTLASILATFIGIAAGAIALIVAGVGCLIGGFAALSVNVFSAVLVFGIGFLLIAIGLGLVIASVWLFGFVVPFSWKWIVTQCKLLYENKLKNLF